MNEHVDVLVIGWGKGGKTLAAAMAKSGQRVAMVEQSDQMYGGTCINIGCVPTKALVHDADTRRDSDDPETWFQNAVSRRDTLTGAMRRKNFSMLDSLDAALAITGRARFTGPREVEVAAGADRMRITADTVVLNTGAVPASPQLDGSRVETGKGRVHDSTSLQHAGELPGHLAVVGGGYVGLEFASMFAHFGSEVTVLDHGDRPLRREDRDVADVAVRALEQDGVRFVTAASVTGIEDSDQAAVVSYTQGGGAHTVEADAVLVALGRRPATEGLNLDAAGIRVDDGGYVAVDEQLRTSAEGVFAVGDVKGGPQFTYISLDDHRIVTDQLLGQGQRSTADRTAVPYTIFLTPPLARVGLTEEQARSAGYDVLVAGKEVPDIAAMPRPKIVGEARGIVKVVVDAATDQVLGAALMHVDSQEVINLLAMAMRHGITASELRDAVYTHPSSTEALNEVLGSLS
ncbi:FAD-dependent oxidoreductase [Arthrobacter castelli]|uniref:FAD-dependent oxidoreductase n=1 Tax=Arthrobacter castelli TaxID=271431 RepID=UPI0003FDA25B|nr:FAD-dependent oxidoreductase [Arthrobacter castelli]